jgi:hypothetical protein
LFRNQGNGAFSEITDSPIVTPVENSEGSCWADLDNYGDLDLVVAGGGNVAIGQNAIFINDGNGSFARLFSGDIVSLPGRYEGATCVDLDKDGDLDLFFSNYNNLDNMLYQNNSSPQNWINVTCVGVQSNRSAIGARLELKTTIGGKGSISCDRSPRIPVILLKGVPSPNTRVIVSRSS